jgi:tRNA pseudouridine(55) synthase
MISLINKEIGVSCQQAMRHLSFPKMAPAGKLDPMADGLLLIVSGDDLKNFDSYLGLDKEYQATIILGYQTDSYDILGIPRKTEKTKNILDYTGDFTFSLPPFSAYKIKGKPSWYWARRGIAVERPVMKTKIYSININQEYTISASELKQEIERRLSLVQGDLRQEEIKPLWNPLITTETKAISVTISCSGGTYIRSLANEIGGTVLGLTRTRIGEHVLKR